MKYIEESVKTSIPSELIFKAWCDNYLKNGMKVGEKGHVVVKEKKGIKFKIEKIVENESLTILWFSHFVKLRFFHKVEKCDVGSLIICRVELKGFFSFLIKPLISNKIRQYIQTSLKQFSRELNEI